MWWLARKTEAMSLEKVGTPKLERRGEGGGGRGPENNKEVDQWTSWWGWLPVVCETRIGYLPRSKLPPPVDALT